MQKDQNVSVPAAPTARIRHRRRSNEVGDESYEYKLSMFPFL